MQVELLVRHPHRLALDGHDVVALAHPDLDHPPHHVRDPGVDGRVRVHAIGEQEARVIRLRPRTLGHDLGERDACPRLDLPQPHQARRGVQRLVSQGPRRPQSAHGEVAGTAHHTDPHPGNLLVLPGPVLAIVDLGLAKEFSAQLRNAVITLAAAIARGDNAAVASAFRALGFRTRSGKDETLVLIGDVFLGQAFTTGRAYANLAMVERIGDEVFTALRKDPLVEASADLLLVLRVMGLLSGIGKQLDSDVDPMAVLLPYLIGGATG